MAGVGVPVLVGLINRTGPHRGLDLPASDSVAGQGKLVCRSPATPWGRGGAELGSTDGLDSFAWLEDVRCVMIAVSASMATSSVHRPRVRIASEAQHCGARCRRVHEDPVVSNRQDAVPPAAATTACADDISSVSGYSVSGACSDPNASVGTTQVVEVVNLASRWPEKESTWMASSGPPGLRR
jgi:hypothetical protein